MSFRKLAIVIIALAVAACGRPEFGTTSSAEENVVESDADRQDPGGTGDATNGDDLAAGGANASPGDVNNDTEVPSERNDGAAVDGAHDFVFTAYRALAADGRNAVLAPHGMARSLVVAHAAVGPEEAEEVAALLQPYLESDSLYDGFNSRDLELEARESASFDMLGAVWAQENVAVEQDFIDTLARYVGLNLRLVDFAAAPEDARATVNNWYRDETDGRLSEVVGPGGVDSETRLMVTDAMWFSARWGFGGFDPEQTEYQNFAGSEADVQVPMMHLEETLFWVAGSDFDAVILPMEGEFSMVAVLPEDLPTFETSLDGDFVERLVNEAKPASVSLGFPGIEVSDRVRLSSVSDALGIGALFDSQTQYAGFADDTVLDDAHQRTRISFSEEGVDAGSETGEDGVGDPAPPQTEVVELTFDRPFFFVIRDNQTGTSVMIGRVAQP